MKVAIRAGHNNLAPGFSLALDETIESRRIKDATISYLLQENFLVLDVTPENMNEYDDSHIPVTQVNNSDADIFISIHFNRNKAPIGTSDYKEYQGDLGSIVWVYQENTPAYSLGEYILDELCSVGFTRRGIKTKRFYDLKATMIPSIRIEICFVEATKDVKLYNSIGIDNIGLLIARGIKNYFSSSYK
ncbi:MAG: N-acetylmuramoyl-L-alanine amidase [Clostridium sp.]